MHRDFSITLQKRCLINDVSFLGYTQSKDKVIKGQTIRENKKRINRWPNVSTAEDLPRINLKILSQVGRSVG
jgi:hypothetical protein